MIFLWYGRFQAPTIAKISPKENLPDTIQGIHKFLKKYTECGTIGRKEGSRRKSNITAEGRRLVNEKMIEDGKTTAKEVKKMLAEHGQSCSLKHCIEMLNRAWVDMLW